MSGSQNKKRRSWFPQTPPSWQILYRTLVRENDYKCANFQLPSSIFLTSRLVRFTVDLYAVCAAIIVQNRVFVRTPPTFDAPVRGVSGRNIAIPFGTEKLQWLGYFEDIFIRFDATHERDRHTDIQTPHDSIGRTYASHRAAKRLRSTFCIEAIQTRSIARPLCDSRASCYTGR